MIRLIFTTFANAEDAAKAVRTLVEENVAACGTILPGARSIYRWKDAIEDNGECLVLLKTSVESYPDLERRLRAIHPYETPEIVALDPAAVSSEYAAWVIRCSGGIDAGSGEVGDISQKAATMGRPMRKTRGDDSSLPTQR